MLSNLPNHVTTVYTCTVPGFVELDNWENTLKRSAAPFWPRAIPGIIQDYTCRGFSLACRNLTSLYWDNGRISPELFSQLVNQAKGQSFENLKILNVSFNDVGDAYGRNLSVTIKKPRRTEQCTEAAESIFAEAVKFVALCPNLEYWRICHGIHQHSRCV